MLSKEDFDRFQNEINMIQLSDPYVVGNSGDIFQEMYDKLEECYKLLNWIDSNPGVHKENIKKAVKHMLKGVYYEAV